VGKCTHFQVNITLFFSITFIKQNLCVKETKQKNNKKKFKNCWVSGYQSNMKRQQKENLIALHKKIREDDDLFKVTESA
jgi:hypothetical protein